MQMGEKAKLNDLFVTEEAGTNCASLQRPKRRSKLGRVGNLPFNICFISFKIIMPLNFEKENTYQI